jgi:hypothetical protein
VVDLNEDVSTTDDEFQRRCPRMVTGGDRGVGNREWGVGEIISLFPNPYSLIPNPYSLDCQTRPAKVKYARSQWISITTRLISK